MEERGRGGSAEGVGGVFGGFYDRDVGLARGKMVLEVSLVAGMAVVTVEVISKLS